MLDHVLAAFVQILDAHCILLRWPAGQVASADIAGAVPSASASDEDAAAALERSPGLAESDEDEAEADERQRDHDDVSCINLNLGKGYIGAGLHAL